ncbi:DNA polymerase I [Myxococcus llanfairpwllgwyngyllgogerychwyrndrobwllllantysiliogogogochensis]|uniref:DNA polymerase I n=1 Tax=Myxococcus llanfairpwllgwyngyllgogerychwyrndrobwllllantysiliogogogochensis TaxID=2590453 RepID=A0A540WTZ4_9BACT|nr:DNA polymerase [Myxococcus llanfairpwllgwyngyllgogerychwyrndrobwllllantysiliogogogochensis]TQF12495.1 DNA polymerase I [Myxococcus llanfairpwllgwyngyllgogerychwyrndrobwllllantysiliogogogochensis]
MNLWSFDTETWLIQPGLLAPPLVCASIAMREPGSECLLDKAQAREFFRAAIAERDTHLVGANLAYDLGVMAADDPRLVAPIFAALEAGRLHCVQIREALIDIARGLYGVDPSTGRKLEDDEGARYPLALLVQRYLGLDISEDKKNPKAWRLRYAELDGVPVERWPREAADYPKRDARYTLDVFYRQEAIAQETPNGGNLHAEAEQMRAAFALHLASIWGLRTNGAAVSQLRERVEREWTENRAKFQKAGIYREDGTKDSKRLAALVTAAYCGEPPITAPSDRFPAGQVATDRDTLLGSGDALLEELGKSGRVDKYKSTYLDVVEAGTEAPINPRFNVLVSTTRVSSDYQQLPQKGGIREVHEARPGFVYCSVDYGGLELRTMAQRAIWELGFSKMADALNSGLDVHTLAAAEFLGASYDELLAKVKAKEPVAVAFRQLAKILNFGKGGGMTGGSLVYNARAKDRVSFCLLAKRADVCGVERVVVTVQRKPKMVCRACVEVAKELDTKWLNAWPEQRELQHRAKSLTYGGGFSDVMIPGANILRGGCGYTQILNTPFQGLGAVGCKRAMWRVSREMYVDRSSPLYGSRLVLMVHDELISELRADDPQRLHDAAERKAEIMRQAMREVTPDLAPAIEAEPALSRYLSKDVATVRDSSGRLVVWEPATKRAA